jgi:predicted O-methyltransferase YrrM
VTLAGRIARKTLPKPAADRLASGLNSYKNYRQLRRELSALHKQANGCTSLEELVELIRAHQIFGAIQQRIEVLSLLRLLAKQPPRYVCEIGSASGGTLFLLGRVCTPDALLISVDLALSRERCLVHTRFADKDQRIICLQGDSGAPEILQRVRSILKGQLLDFLFIDGDHSYPGVKADFTNYRPLLRPGGIIALHDIVPDFNTRYGTPTEHYSGGVPVLWREIRAQHKTSELIENAGQDGFGIGVVHT